MPQVATLEMRRADYEHAKIEADKLQMLQLHIERQRIILDDKTGFLHFCRKMKLVHAYKHKLK